MVQMCLRTSMYRHRQDLQRQLLTWCGANLERLLHQMPGKSIVNQPSLSSISKSKVSACQDRNCTTGLSNPLDYAPSRDTAASSTSTAGSCACKGGGGCRIPNLCKESTSSILERYCTMCNVSCSFVSSLKPPTSLPKQTSNTS